MKKLIFTFTFIMLCAVVFSVNVVALADQQPQQQNRVVAEAETVAPQKQICPLLRSTENSICAFVVDKKHPSEISLNFVGETFKTDIKIDVETNGKTVTIAPTVNYGYDPTVQVFNFLDNGLQQIVYMANSGGSGAYYFVYVYSVKGGQVVEMFNFETFNSNFKPVYAPNYTVLVENPVQNFCVDISQTANLEDFYNADGSVKQNIEQPTLTAFNSAVVETGADGLSKLTVFQKIYGGFTANNYCHVNSTLSFDKTGYKTFGVGLLVF